VEEALLFAAAVDAGEMEARVRIDSLPNVEEKAVCIPSGGAV
jgi:hypothetical protein